MQHPSTMKRTRSFHTQKIPNAVLNLAFSTAVLTAAISPITSNAADVFYYAPQHVGSINGRVYVDRASPHNWLNMSIFGCGPYAASQAISWRVSDFTGVFPPAPQSSYQRGVNNGWYGSTAVQMTDMEMGAHLHTYSLPRATYNHNLSNLQVKYTWPDTSAPRPWTRATSTLRFGFNLKIPGKWMEGGAVGYIYASLLLKDQNGKIVWVQPQIFDTRGVPSTEYLGWDAGTNSGYANSYYSYHQTNTRYCMKPSWSHWSTSNTWSDWRWYEFQMTRSHLLNVINDMNARFGSGFSPNLAGYKVVLFTIQDEIYWPTGNGWLPMGVRDINMLEQY
jgi:hypothetical protein